MVAMNLTLPDALVRELPKVVGRLAVKRESASVAARRIGRARRPLRT
jgi:hypothetical protein